MTNFFKIFCAFGAFLSLVAPSFSADKSLPKIDAESVPLIAADAVPQFGSKEDTPKSSVKFGVQIIPSTLDERMEWWFNLPSNSIPNVVSCNRVLYFQNFSVFSFFNGAFVKNGKFDVSYSIVCHTPNGKTNTITDNARVEGSKISKNIMVASTQAVKVCFDKNSPEGVYKFEITAKDNISGETAKESVDVSLVEWKAPVTMVGRRVVDDAILGFYKNPAPEILYSIFYSRDLNLEQRGAPNELNYIYLGFFRAGFLRNAFLTPYLRREFPNMTPLDRAKTIYLFAIIDEARIDFNILTETERKYQDAMRKADIPAPYADWDPVLGATQIDMLWGEFFADGTYRPIRRIMDLLSYTEEGNFTLTSLMNKRKPANPEEWKKMMLGAYHNAAMRSLLKNAERFELVRKYCQWALENKDIPESSFRLFDDIVRKK